MEASASKEQLQVRRKPEAVRDWLDLLSRRLGPGARLPKAAQLCQELGISANTLDRALRELENQGVITRRHGVGIFVAENRKNLARRILLICHPSFFSAVTHSPFWDLLLSGLRERASRSDDCFECHFVSPTEDSAVLSENLQDEIRRGRVHGVLGIGLGNEAAYFLEEHVPYVSFAGWSSHMIGVNLKAMARLAVQALADKGCRNIGAWLGLPVGHHYDPKTIHIRERTAFRGALHRAGLAFKRQLWRDSRVLPQEGKGLSGQEQGYEMARHFWEDKKQRPDGLIFFDDMVARGALTALSALGVQPGRDVHIATHANAHSDVLLGYDAHVIRVETAPAELVNLMFDQLEALMQNREVPRVTLYAQPRLVLPKEIVSL
jgi:DNA-binding LacI/PurR family transcriptional regulator